MYWPLPPMGILTAAGFLAACLLLIAIELGVHQAWLGSNFRVDQSAHASYWISGSSKPAREIQALASAEYGTMSLLASDLSRAPDATFSLYSQLDQFFKRQQQLSRLKQASDLRIQLADGESLPVRSISPRPLGSLPWLFWYQVLCGIGCWLVGAAIWAFQGNKPAPRYAAMAGFFVMLMMISVAVYSTRELALPSSLFRALWSINHFGALMGVAAFVGLLLHYPRRLVRFDWGGLLLAGAGLIWLADCYQLLPGSNPSLRVVMWAAYLGSFCLLGVQWRSSRGHPVERAALQWFWLSWFVGSGVYLSFILMPTLIGSDSGVMQSYAYGCILLGAVGMAAGITRYRLYELDHWWLRALVVVFGSASVIVVDLLLVNLLHFTQPISLALSLTLSGWLYFPCRQWLARRLFFTDNSSDVERVSKLLDDVMKHRDEHPEYLQRRALRRLFLPLETRMLPAAAGVTKLCIVDDARTMQVPGIGGGAGWEVRWPDRGARLFRRQDLRLADTLHSCCCTSLAITTRWPLVCVRNASAWRKICTMTSAPVC